LPTISIKSSHGHRAIEESNSRKPNICPIQTQKKEEMAKLPAISIMPGLAAI
jgi:hypothetical protein